MSSPIFLLSAGWRSGSTMLQRLLINDGKVLMWGESGGALNQLYRAFLSYEQMLGDGSKKFPGGFGGNGEKQFSKFRKQQGSVGNQWVASMNPPLEVIKSGIRSTLDRIYQVPAEELGYKRWGVKEVVADIDTAIFLMELYPDAKFIFLIRNPVNCLLSIKRRNWMDAPDKNKAIEFFSDHWRERASQFKQADFGKLVYYEELISDVNILLDLARYLEVEITDDKFLQESHVDWAAQNEQQLTVFEMKRIRKRLAKEAKIHGYEV